MEWASCPAWQPSRRSAQLSSLNGKQPKNGLPKSGPGVTVSASSDVGAPSREKGTSCANWPAAVDCIDRADPRTQPMTAEESRAARQVMDSARGAPELFSPVLVDSLLELASDAADATALDALGALVRGARCPPRRALECALAVLRYRRSAEAGRLLAALESDLRPEDLRAVMDQLIALASGEDDDRWRPPTSPEGLIAASRVDLNAVTRGIVDRLASDEDWSREAGADAARILLAIDPARVIALGTPLAASVRGSDAGYGGYPHPAAAALRALAEAWRGEPTLTRRIVETHAATVDADARDELSRVPWFLQRFSEPWDASDTATAEAVSFVVPRAGGDWGDEAADHAAEHLMYLASDLPAEVAVHVDELLGAILPLCAPDRDASAVATGDTVDAVVAGMERESLRIRRDARRAGLPRRWDAVRLHGPPMSLPRCWHCSRQPRVTRCTTARSGPR